LVVGEGSPPFHTGLGFFNNEQHCLGWNRGTNPLPFVLVEDVAEAILLAARAPDLEGRCYNLVGDVRLTAREYIELLAEALQRPLRFHPQSPRKLWIAELAKWTIKRATGRRVPVPTLRDIRSRGLRAVFDCSDAKRDLGWRPTSDRERFISRAILVHTDRS
jgi:nucleoside-diphosphate-sugar epimerase